MSTILDALAKARQEKERRGLVRPRAAMPSLSPHRKKRRYGTPILAVAAVIAGALMVVFLRPPWAEPVLAGLGLVKKQPAAPMIARKSPAPSSSDKTAPQSAADTQPGGFLEILMKSKEPGSSTQGTPAPVPVAAPEQATKSSGSDKTMPPFLQKLQQPDAGAQTTPAPVSSPAVAPEQASQPDESQKNVPLFLQKLQQPAAGSQAPSEQPETQPPAPTPATENPLARFLQPQQAAPSQESSSSAPPIAPSQEVQTASGSAGGAQELFNQGIDLEKAGKLEEAETAYRKAIGLDKTFARAYINLGNLYLNHRKNPKQAISYYRRALENSPKNPKAHNNMGAAYMAQGQLDKAEAEFLKAAQSDPAFVDPLYNMACVFARKGDAAAALSWLKKAHAQGGTEVVQWAANDQDMKSLHSLPEYKDFLKKITSAQEKPKK